MSLIEKWEYLKVLVDSIELDVKKRMRGNKSAGVRVRKGLREVKKSAAEFIRQMVTEDKAQEQTPTPE